MSSQRNWPPSTPGTPTGSGQAGTDATDSPSRNEVFQGLADDRRREILAVLIDRSGPVSERELARELTTAESDDVQTAHTSLRHVHLPTLEAIPLVHWDRDEQRVRTTDHPAFDDEAIRRIVRTDADVDGLLDALADERRRLVLAVLYTYGGPVDRETVAEKVSELERDDFAPDASDDAADVRTSLHHVHLPKLQSAGLVTATYDETVEYVDHPDVDESWFTF